MWFIWVLTSKTFGGYSAPGWVFCLSGSQNKQAFYISPGVNALSKHLKNASDEEWAMDLHVSSLP